MRIVFGTSLAALGITAAISAVSAAPINGTLSLSGVDTFTATSVTFSGSGNIGADSGSFAGLGTCFSCVALTSFNSGSTNFSPYLASNNGLSSSITLSGVTFDFHPNTGGTTLDNLTVTGSGVAHLTGFDDTPGNFILTTQGIAGSAVEVQFTFSSTTVATGSNPPPPPPSVPEPSTLALLGAGLVGFGWLSRRRTKCT